MVLAAGEGRRLAAAHRAAGQGAVPGGAACRSSTGRSNGRHRTSRPRRSTRTTTATSWRPTWPDSDVHVSVEEDDALGTAGALGRAARLDRRARRAARQQPTPGRPPICRRLLSRAPAGRPTPPRSSSTTGDPPRLRATGATRAPRCCRGQWPRTLDTRAVRPLRGLLAARLEPDLVPAAGPFIDCGTPARYLDANLTWSGGGSVIGAGAGRRRGGALGGVPSAVVDRGERLVDAVRATTA